MEQIKLVLKICSDLSDSTLEQFFMFSYISSKGAMIKETFFLESMKLEQIFIFDKTTPSLERIRLNCYKNPIKSTISP